VSAPAASATGLAGAPVGVVPIVWNNADLLDLAPELPASTVLDEVARLGYAGCQFGRGFPDGEELRRELAERGLRLAERYCALPTTPTGLAEGARNLAHATLDRLIEAGGEVLVVALDGSPERDAWSGRVAQGAPRWPEAGFAQLAGLVDELADAAPDGARIAFHPHSATWIEAPDEAERLAEMLRRSRAGICLDVGHYLVGGGDPVEALGRFGDQVLHLHLKDVDASVLRRLRNGGLNGFGEAVRERIFTELGNGLLDLPGVLRELAARDYPGWLMVEQDTSWLPPSEAAAIGRRVLDAALRWMTIGSAEAAA
jgi:inosose dehydratase